MKKDIFFLGLITIITLFIGSCRSVSSEKSSPENGICLMDNCLENGIPDYLERVDLFFDILNRNDLLDEKKDSYVNLFRTIDQDTLGSTSINLSGSESVDMRKLDLQNDIHAKLHFCSSERTKDEVLSKGQKQFYEEFDVMGRTGFLDKKKVGEVINKLTQKEFTSCSVKEVCIIYLGEYIILEN